MSGRFEQKLSSKEKPALESDKPMMSGPELLAARQGENMWEGKSCYVESQSLTGCLG